MSINGGFQPIPFSKAHQGKSTQNTKPTESTMSGKTEHCSEQQSTQGQGNSATLADRHQGPREIVASEQRHPLAWQYYPVPGLHMGNQRELQRPEKGASQTVPSTDIPSSPENTEPVMIAEEPINPDTVIPNPTPEAQT